MAAAVFAVSAVAATAAIHASGRQIADIELYRSYGDAMESGLVPYRDFDVEYPPGALGVFALPSLLTASPDDYYRLFAALMAVVGAVGVVVTAVTLRRLRRSRGTTRKVLALLALSPLLLGGVLLTRFDLVPATIVAVSTLLLVCRRWRLAAAALGVAAAVKLYPLALLPVLVTCAWRQRGRREGVLAGAIAIGVALLAFLPFLVLSPGGVVASVGGQLGRPLQIESLGAGLLLAVHSAAGLPLEIESSHGSDNVAGAAAAACAAVLATLQLGFLTWLWLRFARAQVTTERTVRYVAACLFAFVAFGKVLSPQFLVWLLFAVPLVAGTAGAAAGVMYALAALATAIWFPALYHQLEQDQDPALSLLVVVRGLALVAALAALAWPATALSAAMARAAPRSRSPSPYPGRR